MSHWDGHRIVRWSPQPIEGHSAWIEVDCGCCSGLRWGGETPEECSTCQGRGAYALHGASGALALYPGGPFVGRKVPA